MIDGLIAGKLYGTAQTRTGQSGKTFVTAKVRAAGGDGETLFVNVITFSDTAAAALLALEDGDAVALAGTLSPKVWTDKHGEARPALDMVAHAVLTAYHVRRKRKAVQPEEPGPVDGAHRDMDDDL
ncbi:single-stranded DNA-binding protein [Paraburkholderia sp. 35.1]|uniref:single-stranded DNA-binding protein n=1 Tax=Paraburkholderia sp. 35.1 TaxID=2991058 RepID=UPI003D243477